MPRLDGAVPHETDSRQEIALAALTRRVAELEHRLDRMKIIVGLVLAAKVLFVVLFIYIWFGNILLNHGGPAGQPILMQKSIGSETGTAGLA